MSDNIDQDTTRVLMVELKAYQVLLDFYSFATFYTGFYSYLAAEGLGASCLGAYGFGASYFGASCFGASIF